MLSQNEMARRYAKIDTIIFVCSQWHCAGFGQQFQCKSIYSFRRFLSGLSSNSSFYFNFLSTNTFSDESAIQWSNRMSTYGSDRINLRPESLFTSNDTTENKRNYFEKLNTIALTGIHLLLSLTIFGAGAFFELKWTTDFDCTVYYYILYVRCAFWLVTFVIDSMITRRHNNIRRSGYHDFYRYKILNYKNAPLNIVTLWNMIIFLIQTIMQQNYGADFSVHCKKTIWSPITYICLFCGIESILLMIVHGTYIMRVWHFNQLTNLPDALRDVEQPFFGTLGMTIEKNKDADLLEKQADLIYYLKEQNNHLNQKLNRLNERYKNYHWNENYAPI